MGKGDRKTRKGKRFINSPRKGQGMNIQNQETRIWNRK